MKKCSWWRSLARVAKVKTFLAWIVLLVLPAFAVILEVRQKMLESERDRQDVVARETREREHGEETAKIEKQREALRHEVDTLKKQARDRRITEEQKRKILGALSGITNKATLRVRVACVTQVAETSVYSDDMVNLFREAGFAVSDRVMQGKGSWIGLGFAINPSSTANHALVIRDAFRDAGVEFIVGMDPQVEAHILEIRVGDKPSLQ